MRLAPLSLLSALALFAGAGRALRDWATYQPRDYPAAGRALILDVTVIGYKWRAVAGGLACAGGASLFLSMLLYARGRNSLRR